MAGRVAAFNPISPKVGAILINGVQINGVSFNHSSECASIDITNCNSPTDANGAFNSEKLSGASQDIKCTIEYQADTSGINPIVRAGDTGTAVELWAAGWKVAYRFTVTKVNQPWKGPKASDTVWSADIESNGYITETFTPASTPAVSTL